MAEPQDEVPSPGPAQEPQVSLAVLHKEVLRMPLSLSGQLKPHKGSPNAGEATPRGPQTIPIFRTQNQGTRPDLMKTTSARQKALAKLKRADRNVLDASQC